MSVTVKQILTPKKNGGSSTIIRQGFTSTIVNSGNDNIQNDIITASQLNATNADIQNANVNNLNVNKFQTSGPSAFNGDITTKGNVYFQSSQNNAFDKTVNLEQVITYLGDHNHFDELTGSQTSNISSHNITTEYLTVTKSAHFYELILDKVKAAGGSVLFTPADGFKIDKVDDTTFTDAYILYWRACKQVAEGNIGDLIYETGQTITEEVSVNMWQTGDQALCETFNLSSGSGTYHNISNRFWWRAVSGASSSPEIQEIDGVKYYVHWIKVYKTGNSYVAQDSDAPEVGDEVAMLGNQIDNTRQGAIYMAAYNSMDRDLVAPLFAEYTGINDFSLYTHKKNWIATSSNNGVASTQIRGNIVLSGGDTVENYVDDAVAGIQTGSQFYTNLIVFENQNINAACNNAGTPYANSLGTDFWCMHGIYDLNIVSISSPYQYAYFSYSGRTGNITIPSSYYSYLNNNTTEIPITVTAYESGTSGNTITFNGSAFVNKVKDGADGSTPIIYELITDTKYRTLTYTSPDNSSWTMNPLTFKTLIQKTDYSAVTKVEDVQTVPNGMTLFYRMLNKETNEWSRYINITSSFNTNGYWESTGGSTGYRKYDWQVILYNAVVNTDMKTSDQSGDYPIFDDTKIYDILDIPTILNGEYGEGGENGVNIYYRMSEVKSYVDKEDVLHVKFAGNLIYMDGDTVDTSHVWNNSYISFSSDNYNAYTQNLSGTAYLNASTGYFYFGPVNINNYSSISYSYRPLNMIATFTIDNNPPYNNTYPITFEPGGVIEITDSIDLKVRNVENGLYDTGINIQTGTITLQANKIAFTKDDGSTNENLSIDATTGTLNAVNANLSGIFKSENTSTLYKTLIDTNNGAITLWSPKELTSGGTPVPGTTQQKTADIGWYISPYGTRATTIGQIRLYDANESQRMNTLSAHQMYLKDQNYGVTINMDGITYDDWNNITATNIDWLSLTNQRLKVFKTSSLSSGTLYVNINSGYSMIIVNHSWSGDFTINLPNPASCEGKYYFIKNKKGGNLTIKALNSQGGQLTNGIMNDNDNSYMNSINIETASTQFFCDGEVWIMMELDY